MNKYQEALNILVGYRTGFRGGKTMFQEYINTLQELVDKATPKKVLHKHKEYFYYDEEQPFPSSKITGVCPVCNHSFEQADYCPRCGQAIDWR